MKYLSKRQILLIHQELLETSGGTSGLRDEGLLDSALMTPLQSFGGQDLYPSLIAKAVRLAFGLIKNHPFIDGNKRIGTHAMLVFLALNGAELSYTDDEMIAIILSMAAGQVDESDLRAWIDEHLL